MTIVTQRKFIVPYSPVGTTYGDAELKALVSCLTGSETLSCGRQRDLFEAEFAAYIGVRHAISVANCTVALEMAAYLCDLKPGDEVIATAQSYQATVTPLLTSPATVRFCDVDPLTLNIDPAAIERLITERTRAIFLVHYGGDMADIAAIRALADSRGIIIIEDCAHAVGASRDRVRPGAIGGIGCFSFQSYKNISTLGEGGMLTTDSDEWAYRLRRLRSIEPDAEYAPRITNRLGPYQVPDDGVFRHEKEAFTDDCLVVRHPGTNSTLAEPAAAVGRVQLGRIEELVARRAAIAAALDDALRDLPGVIIQPRPTNATSAHHLYTVFIEDAARVDQLTLMGRLVEEGIEIQQRYFPLHLLSEWRRLGNDLGLCPVTEHTWFHRQLNLPIYPQMTDFQLSFMIDALVRNLSPR